MEEKKKRIKSSWQPPGIDPTTKTPFKRRYYYGATQEEADRKRDEDRAAFGNPDTPTPSADHDLHMLAGLLWWPRVEGSRPNTIRRYRDAYTRHVRPKWGHLYPKDVRPADVQRWINDMRSKGVAPASITLYRGILSSVLKLAAAEGLIPSNPASAVKMPKVKKRVRVVPPTGVRDLLAAVDGTELAAPVFLASVLGLSRGELCGLRWKTIDVRARRISIVEQRLAIQGDKSGKYVGTGPVKRESRERSFVLPSEIFEPMLHFVNQESDFLCVRSKERGGGPWNPERLTCEWAAHRKALGFEEWHFHDLRHAAAGVLAFAGCDLLTIAAILGHASVDMSMLYAAAQEATATRGFLAVSDLLFPKPDGEKSSTEG
jgi:integrase